MLRLTLFGRFSAAGAGGAEIPLRSQKATALLAYLALPPGKPRSREEVMALLWSERGDAQARSSLRQVLTGLRKDLGEQAMTALHITDDAVWLDPDKVIVAAANTGEELLAGFHLHDPAFEEWLRDERLRLEDTAAPGDQPAGPSLPDKPSIAVLPFTNMSGDPEQEYFSDGITDDIITELSRYQSLFIIARNSSFVYKGRAVNVRIIGRELGVEYVVEGSIRKAGNRVRINAQLVEAATGNHLWAERYDRELEDIFAVQDEVTQAIAAILPTKLSQAVFARARRKPTDNLTAYDYLLRGERYLRENYGDPEALKMLKKAIEIDPQCARAYAHSAVHYLYQVFASGMPAEESTRKAQEQIDRALAIDDDDSSIHSVAGLAYLLLGQHDRAKIHSERAIALNPNDVSAIFKHGFVLTYLGDAVGGLEWFRKGRRLDPHEPESGVEDWLEVYYMARQYEKAIETFRRWRNPPFHMFAELAACYAQLGRNDEAQAAVAEYERQRPEDYNFAKFAAAHIKACARQEDRDHWMDGYRKAGFDV